jgi:hypothetical protein
MTTRPSSRTYVARTGQTSTHGASWQCRHGRLKKKVWPALVFSSVTIFHTLSGLTSLVAEQARRQYSQPMQVCRLMSIPVVLTQRMAAARFARHLTLLELSKGESGRW